MFRLLTTLTLALLTAASAHAQSTARLETATGPVTVEKFAGPFEHPWSIAFLPDNMMLVTERSGILRVIDNGKVSGPVSGVPSVRARGQGGLLDVAVPPNFAEEGKIYLTYSEPDGVLSARTALARADLVRASTGGFALRNVEVLFQQQPSVSGGRHFGSRIIFAADGTLFVTLGERGNREAAQDLKTHLGKVIRLNRDGSIPPDNPFAGRDDALPEIWSYGHRNPQGAVMRASDQTLFTISHGARGGDEVNRVKPGANYGWPTISFGRHYSGGQIGVGTSAPGMEQPLHYWDPSIAPSGATLYEGDAFPQWRGNLFVGALAGGLISRMTVDGTQVTEVEQMFQGQFGRIRDVRTGPEGALWFVNDDSDGAIYRVTPAQ